MDQQERYSIAHILLSGYVYYCRLQKIFQVTKKPLQSSVLLCYNVYFFYFNAYLMFSIDRVFPEFRKLIRTKGKNYAYAFHE